MADIELVIKIPRKTYEHIRANGGHGYLLYDKDNRIVTKAVFDGKPLPKGHGRLKDVDRLESHDEYDGQGFTKSVYKDDIDSLPPIIEADKGRRRT